MTEMLQREQRFLHLPLGTRPRLVVVAAALVLAFTMVFPLWRLTMFAPQYPGGLRLDIYASGLQAGRGGQDLAEINILNHYIGMRDLSDESFAEFQWMPFVLGGLGLLFLRAAVLGEMKTLVDATAVYLYVALFSLWSFAYQLYAYGHDLSPTAPVTVAPFMPPVFGSKQLANFEVYSYPAAASYALAAAGILLFFAAWLAWRERAAPERVGDASPTRDRPTVPARAAGR